jgi:hypothetical protein
MIDITGSRAAVEQKAECVTAAGTKEKNGPS